MSETCRDHELNPNQYAGSENKTEESVAKVIYKSHQRGELIRYLKPGDAINLPADRVEVQALQPGNG